MNEAQDLQTLYRQTVLDHSRNPRNCKRLVPADRIVVGHNPLCGDKITLYLRLDDDRIERVAFEGSGCAISMAAASIMTETVNQRVIDDARHEIGSVMRNFQPADTGVEHDEPNLSAMGDMAALTGVRAFPSRIKCATLAWKTLEAALDDNTQKVTTED